MALTKVSVSMQDNDVVYAKDFIPDGTDTATTDCTTFLNNAFAAGKNKLVLLEPNATYKCSAQLNVKGSVDGQYATLEFHSTSFINALVFQDVEGSLRNFTIDGANVTDGNRGLSVDTNYTQTQTCYYDLVVKNISTNSTADHGCTAALFFQNSSDTNNLNPQLDIKIDCENIVANGDNTGGNSRGVARGIHVGFNNTGTDAKVYIHDCTIDTISSGGSNFDEDSDGVHVQTADYQTANAKGTYLIDNVTCYYCYKRGFKVQAPNTTIRNCINYGQNTSEGFATYSANTVYDNCKNLLGSNTGFSSDWLDTTMNNCYAEITGNSHAVALNADCERAKINGMTIKSTATFTNNQLSQIIFKGENASVHTLTNIYMTGTTNTGSGISFIGTCTDTPIIDGLYINGFEYGVIGFNNTGRVRIRNMDLTVTHSGLYREGNSAFPIFISDSFISAGNIGIYTNHSGGASSCLVFADNVKINGTSHGILGADGSNYHNCEITGGGTTGFGISSGNSSIRNNRIINYNNSVSYTSTTTAEVSNNSSINANGTAYLTTGYTPYIDHDNYSR